MSRRSTSRSCSGAETTAAGIAIADYARPQPDTTFLIALAPAAEATLSRPAPNVFRFTPHALQWTAGLGTYAYRTLGWRTAVVVGNDFSYPYDEAAGFIAEFCWLGGKVVGRVRASATPPAVRTRADGYFVTVFVSQLLAGAVRALPVEGDLAHRAAARRRDDRRRRRRARGTVRPGSSGRRAGPTPAHPTRPGRVLLADYTRHFRRLRFLGLGSFYFDTLEPALRGLEDVGGDLSDGGGDIAPRSPASSSTCPRSRPARLAPPGDRTELPSSVGPADRAPDFPDGRARRRLLRRPVRPGKRAEPDFAHVPQGEPSVLGLADQPP